MTDKFDACADFHMDDHHVVLTGGAQNIGAGIARTLPAAGWVSGQIVKIHGGGSTVRLFGEDEALGRCAVQDISVGTSPWRSLAVVRACLRLPEPGRTKHPA
ncbi:hypothetical protein [Primorskyibacter flagellatus]|uniref:hypothetical protein n=1 Tax=Primorskyibacter flagellatus TaxID=1387277 RepID=UPI003A918F5E